MTQEAKWSRDYEYEQVAHARLEEAMRQANWLRAAMNGQPLPMGYKCGPTLRALVGREPVNRKTGESDLRWHISVNGSFEEPRLPTWHELVECAHQIRPGVTFVVGIPPRSWWMADLESGKYVLHLWQLKDDNLEKSWFDQRTPGGRAPS